VIFLGGFSHCGWLQLVFEEIGKFCFESVNSREKCWKNGKSLQTEKLRKKKEKEKENTGKEVYMCAL
jgi:hypothetical protein